MKHIITILLIALGGWIIGENSTLLSYNTLLGFILIMLGGERLFSSETKKNSIGFRFKSKHDL